VASNALLDVTVMCAKRRCDAVVHALHHETDTPKSSTLGTLVGCLARTHSLADRMRLSVECSTVSVAAKIISHGEETNENGTGPVNQLSNDGQGSAVGG
jgi:hypothetical protein